MTTTTAGKSLTLSDGVSVLSSEPEYRTILELDSRLMTSLRTWGGGYLRDSQWSQLSTKVFERPDWNTFTFGDSDWNKLTFGDLRRAWSGMGAIKQFRLTDRLQNLIHFRLSSHILCGCGRAKILHRHHVACSRPGCEAFKHERYLYELRLSFPDQISEVRGE